MRREPGPEPRSWACGWVDLELDLPVPDDQRQRPAATPLATASSPVASATGVNDNAPSVPKALTWGRSEPPGFRLRDGICAQPARRPGNRGTRAPYLRWRSRRWKWCSERMVGRVPWLQRFCNGDGLPLDSSRKHPTAETLRNRAKRPTPIRSTFAAFRLCSPAFAD